MAISTLAWWSFLRWLTLAATTSSILMLQHLVTKPKRPSVFSRCTSELPLNSRGSSSKTQRRGRRCGYDIKGGVTDSGVINAYTVPSLMWCKLTLSGHGPITFPSFTPTPSFLVNPSLSEQSYKRWWLFCTDFGGVVPTAEAEVKHWNTSNLL